MKRAIGLHWTSSRSCTGGQCVQVAALNDSVAVRDSKDPDGAILVYSVSEWRAFLEGAKNGDFDHLL